MTIQELKQAIVDEVAAIVEDLQRRVNGNFQTRLQQCINLLTPNVNYSGRTAPLTSKVAFYIFIQQI